MNSDFETIIRFWPVFVLLVIAVIAVIVVAKMRYRRRAAPGAGAVLIDCGRNTQGTFILILAGLLFVLAFPGHIVGDWLGFTIWAAIVVLFFLPDCLYRVRLCENAILHNESMMFGGCSVPWLDITAIEWSRPWLSGGRVLRATLTLRGARGLWGISGSGVQIIVPESKVAEVERLILARSGAEVRDAAHQARAEATSSPR